MNHDEIIENPNEFGEEKILNIIEELTQYEKTKLKFRIKKLLREETSLPFREQNSIFVQRYMKTLNALNDKNKGNIKCSLDDLIGIKDKAVNLLLKTVKREEANIRKILNTCLSAFTDDPLNLAYVSESSTGKTYLVENVISLFPAEYLIKSKSISRKAFTRERGKLVVKTFTEDGANYNETIENAFTGREMSVSEYLNYLNYEIEKKDNKENPDLIHNLQEARTEIMDNMLTLIDFTDKILVLLDRPSKGFWVDMLTIASHDSKYLESSYVEGEGKKYTKHIVYKNWPAIIFCTSKDEDFTWGDLETRFELAAPFESSEKFLEAIDLSLDRKFGVPQVRDPGEKTIRNLILQLTAFMKEHRPRAYLPLPSEIRKTFLGDKIERPGLMRKFPRLMSHIALNTLFNAPDRVIFKNDGEHVLVSPEDFRELLKEFSNNELNAALHGFTEPVFLFLNEVLIPACSEGDTLDGSFKNPAQSEVCKALSESNLSIGKTKQMCGRYLRSLEERNVIKREKSETDKRGLLIIPLIDTLESLSKRIEDSVEELVNTYRKALPEDIEKLLKQNFKAFHRDVEISKLTMEETGQKIVNQFTDHNIMGNNEELQKEDNTGFLITLILEKSGYFTGHFTNFSEDHISYLRSHFTNVDGLQDDIQKDERNFKNHEKGMISDLSLIEEEVIFITHREGRVPLIQIAEKWHSLSCPSLDELRNIAAKLATMDYSLLRLQNDVIEWIEES